MRSLNYKHLYYFWVVAKEGGMARAAERLGMAVQTISSQVRDLERVLGRSLFAAEGRRLVLTEAGRMTLGYADQIFLLGEQMCEALGDETEAKSLRLAVGVTDALPKLVSYRLLEVTQHLKLPVRLSCREGKFEHLISELALHRVDVILTDRAVAPTEGGRVFSHELGGSDIGFYGVPDLAATVRTGFPGSLHGARVLLPSRSTALRARLDQWFETNNIRPMIAAEFDDSALMKTFARHGMGIFPASLAMAEDLQAVAGAELIGEVPGVREQYYAISNERRISHPAVEAIRAATQDTIFPL